jgi:NDP-sugar pyrophosphorylase family protein
VLLRNEKRERFSVVNVEQGHVTGFGGMPEATGETVPLMFTGIQLLEPRIFDYIPRGVFSHSTTDVYPQAIANGETIAAHVAYETWRELSTFQRYLDISMELVKNKGRLYVAGAKCVVPRSASVEYSVLWDNVKISEKASIRRCIFGDGVELYPGEVLENCVVVRRELVEGKTPPEKAKGGYIYGENYIVPL